jgi:hypothetical protein
MINLQYYDLQHQNDPAQSFVKEPMFPTLAKNIFSRMDENSDGHLTEEEFLRGCLQDNELSKMLVPNVVQ